jgi:hypothetical protein
MRLWGRKKAERYELTMVKKEHAIALLEARGYGWNLEQELANARHDCDLALELAYHTKCLLELAEKTIRDLVPKS